MKKLFTIFGLLALMGLSGVLNAQTTWIPNSVAWPYYSSNLFDIGPYPPTRTVDNDTTTFIYTLNGGTIRYDLGSNQNINSFKYLDGDDGGGNSYPTAHFTVSYSTSSTGSWINVIDTIYSSPSALFGWRYFNFNIVSARYWQVYSNGVSNYHTRIWEIGFGASCSNVNRNDTTIYFVSNPSFQSSSPKSYFVNTENLTTTVGGCDSVVNHYLKYIYNPTYCSVTDTLIIDVTLTGVSAPNNTNTLKVYPNPAKDFVIINTGNYASMSNYTLKIENTLGQTVYTTAINQAQFQVNVNSFGGLGVYFVKIIDNTSNVVSTKKIILQ